MRSAVFQSAAMLAVTAGIGCQSGLPVRLSVSSLFRNQPATRDVVRADESVLQQTAESPTALRTPAAAIAHQKVAAAPAVAPALNDQRDAGPAAIRELVDAPDDRQPQLAAAGNDFGQRALASGAVTAAAISDTDRRTKSSAVIQTRHTQRSAAAAENSEDQDTIEERRPEKPVHVIASYAKDPAARHRVLHQRPKWLSAIPGFRSSPNATENAAPQSATPSTDDLASSPGSVAKKSGSPADDVVTDEAPAKIAQPFQIQPTAAIEKPKAAIPLFARLGFTSNRTDDQKTEPQPAEPQKTEPKPAEPRRTSATSTPDADAVAERSADAARGQQTSAAADSSATDAATAAETDDAEFHEVAEDKETVKPVARRTPSAAEVELLNSLNTLLNDAASEPASTDIPAAGGSAGTSDSAVELNTWTSADFSNGVRAGTFQGAQKAATIQSSKEPPVAAPPAAELGDTINRAADAQGQSGTERTAPFPTTTTPQAHQPPQKQTSNSLHSAWSAGKPQSPDEAAHASVHRSNSKFSGITEATVQTVSETRAAESTFQPLSVVPPAGGDADDSLSMTGVDPISEVGQPLAPVDATLINLPTALSMVGGEHPAVALARWRVQEAYAELDQAEVLWLPSLQAGFSFHRHDGNYQASNGAIVDVNRNSFQFGLGNGATGAGTTPRPGLQANFHLADAIFQPDIARKAAWAQGHSENAVLNRQLLQVALSYLRLLDATQQLRIVEESRARVADVATLTENFAAAGEGLQADADRMQTEVALIDARIIQAEEEVELASSALIHALSADAGRPIVPMDAAVVPLHLVPLEQDRDALIHIGLNARPELKQLQALVAAACEQHKRQQLAPFVPSVMLGVSAGGFGGGLGDSIDSVDERYDFDALVTWEVRNLGFGERAARRRSAAQLQQAMFRKVRRMDDVAREISDAHTQVVQRGRRVEVAERAIRSAEDSYDRNMSRIRDGQGLPLEVLQSVRALEVARLAYADAVIAYNEAQFRLQWALGWKVCGEPA